MKTLKLIAIALAFFAPSAAFAVPPALSVSGLQLQSRTVAPGPTGTIRLWYKSTDTTLHLLLADNSTDLALANLTGVQTFTNKTLTSPVINGATSASGDFDLSGSSGAFQTPTGASTFNGSSNVFVHIINPPDIKLQAGGGLYDSALGKGLIMGNGTSNIAVYGASFQWSQDSTYGVGIPSGRPLTVAAVDTGGAKPTCDATTRGFMTVVAAAGGASDTFVACMKAAADTYSWVVVKTAP